MRREQASTNQAPSEPLTPSGNSAGARAEHLRASPPIFENRLLDRLSRVHPLVPPVIYIPVIVILIALEPAPIWQVAVALIVGYVLWTLVEYWGHRVIFHFEPENGWGARLHFIIHGIHHEHPNDWLRLVMPPLMSVPILLLAYLVLSIVLSGAWLNGVTAGFCAGYLAYDMTHYYVHHFTPRTWVGRALRSRHMHHHFRDENSCYGVSAPWWDIVFGTSVQKPGKRA